MSCANCKTFVFIVVLCIFTNGQTLQKLQVSEAQLIALESSGEILPPADLSKTIEYDLKAIRLSFPPVSKIIHSAKWETGKLLVTNLSDHTLLELNRSSFGPAEAKEILQTQLFEVQFTKPYNPEKLLSFFKGSLFQMPENAIPNYFTGGDSEVKLIKGQNGMKTYTFTQGGSGIDCLAGCIEGEKWKFEFSPSGSVHLVKGRGKGSI